MSKSSNSDVNSNKKSTSDLTPSRELALKLSDLFTSKTTSFSTNNKQNTNTEENKKVPLNIDAAIKSGYGVRDLQLCSNRKRILSSASPEISFKKIKNDVRRAGKKEMTHLQEQESQFDDSSNKPKSCSSFDS